MEDRQSFWLLSFFWHPWILRFSELEKSKRKCSKDKKWIFRNKYNFLSLKFLRWCSRLKASNSSELLQRVDGSQKKQAKFTLSDHQFARSKIFLHPHSKIHRSDVSLCLLTSFFSHDCYCLIWNKNKKMWSFRGF